MFYDNCALAHVNLISEVLWRRYEAGGEILVDYSERNWMEKFEMVERCLMVALVGL